ncbi:SAM-dependent methyltransferase [Kribbella sandramycini]|uniref:Putative O-methyltransferase YrrM n=1 Tax=Kribbella sandramycini TaxID=60450 RepID=A0A7Y4L403_9ACTN|nr:class I SAM-dependent methyltransferase [Kribbella sandramycini]MBB6566322.1 putative O-methyltransferase YrrM [Kribbella sandramycini]NOL43016.1 SAM-dependent methyltransferase [Kribbella sandramycini]
MDLITTTPPVAEPARAAKARSIAERARLTLASDPRTGQFLRTMAAAKPGGRLLELGSQTGVGTGWLLDGMDADARLTTIEIFPRIAEACRQTYADEPRVEVITADATEWLEQYDGPPFDLIFVDTTDAKFHRRDLVLAHLVHGGLLLADDLLPQEKWTDEHLPRVQRLRDEIGSDPELVVTLVDWASGLLVAARR